LLARLTEVDELKRAEQRLVVDPVVSLFRHICPLYGGVAAEGISPARAPPRSR
jgi:hypothetical protein